MCPVVLQESIRDRKQLREALFSKLQKGDESGQFAEMTAILLTLDIADRKKWPVLYLCIGWCWNALWGCLQQGKQCNWLCKGKLIWAAALLQDTAVRKSASANATEKHQNNQQVDQADKIEMAQVDLDW